MGQVNLAAHVLLCFDAGTMADLGEGEVLFMAFPCV